AERAAGVVDQQVDLGRQLGGERGHALGDSHVEGQRRGWRPSGGGDRRLDRLQAVEAPGAQEHAVAGGGQGFRGRLSDSGAGACHDRGLLNAHTCLQWSPRSSLRGTGQTSADGQRSATTQAAQSGLRALHTLRPWSISSSEKVVQSACGTSGIRSCSIFSGSFSALRARRPERRWTWVSTTTPSFSPKALPSTTLAVLRPTPGSARRSSMRGGTSPPWSAVNACASAWIARALLR